MVITRGQRIILILTFAVTAVVAHLAVCDFKWNEPYGHLAVGWSVNRPGAGFPGAGALHHYGVVLKPETERAAGIGVGVVVPFALIGAALALLAGLPRATRRERGSCLQCGYALNFQYHTGCPECGWRRE